MRVATRRRYGSWTARRFLRVAHCAHASPVASFTRTIRLTWNHQTIMKKIKPTPKFAGRLPGKLTPPVPFEPEHIDPVTGLSHGGSFKVGDLYEFHPKHGFVNVKPSKKKLVPNPAWKSATRRAVFAWEQFPKTFGDSVKP